MNISNYQWNMLWECIHILAKTYIPSGENKDAFKCFFECLSELIPNIEAQNNMKNFMYQVPISQWLDCNNKTFEWSYKLHNYINVVKHNPSKMNFISLDQAIEKYTNIDKKRWGNSIWFTIHWLCANVNDQMTHTQKINIKALLVCLRFLLPCGECRNHMSTYLATINIDRFLNTRYNLYLWSWEFHNSVNIRLNKPTVDFKSSYFYYSIPKYGYEVIEGDIF
jgi:hypothetical protein